MRVIRTANIFDAHELALIQERTFRVTFEQDNNPDDMAAHCAKTYSAEIQRQEILNRQLTTLLCIDDDVLIGFVQLRCGQAPVGVTGQNTLEIQRLYVDKPWHGSGVAHDLMNAAIEQAKSHQADRIWLGVWEKNPRAIKFYEKFDFVVVGEHIFTVGTDQQRDLIMQRVSLN